MGSKGVSFLAHSAQDALQFAAASSPSPSVSSTSTNGGSASLYAMRSPRSRSREEEVAAISARMRKLEHELDEAMVQYSECEKQFERIGYDRQISPAKASVLLKDTSDRVSLLEADLMCRLNKLEDALSDLLGFAGLPSADAALLHHRPKVAQYHEATQSAKSALLAACKRAWLLTDTSSGGTGRPGGALSVNRELELLAAEHRSLTFSDHAADAFISQGLQVNRAIQEQDSVLMMSGDDLSEMRNQMPDISSLIDRIRRRETRNAIILSVFIATLICLLLYYWLRFSR